MNGKSSTATVAGVGVVGLVLGLAAGGLFFAKFAPHARASKRIRAEIVLLDDNLCEQHVGRGQFRFPVLVPHRTSTGDTIEWYGRDGRTGHSGPLPVDVKFPNTLTGTPFVDSHGQPKYEFTTGENSGESTANSDDYPFDSVTVDGNPCKLGDPGVHIDE